MNLFLNSSDSACISILGTAFDFGSTGILGAAKAPEVLSHLSKLSGGEKSIYDAQTDKKLFDLNDINGLGILKFKNDTTKFLQALELLVGEAAKSTAPVIIGGDHLVTLPAIKGVLKEKSELQVLHFDAHFDANSIHNDSEPAHNNFVSFLVKEEKIKKWIMVGQRGPWSWEKRTSYKCSEN
jgi:arginase family enzyme